MKGNGPCVTAVKPRGETSRPPCPHWPKPQQGWVALSVDGSSDADGHAGAGTILRDGNGAVIFSAYRSLFHCNDALESEVCALMEGISIALGCSDLPITI
jgi:hypothetical protein